jgi:uncharacterized peroxidase-related enzyme
VAEISRFPVPTLDSLPDDIRERILAVQERTGFVPNVFLALAHRPEEWRAFVAYQDALMEREEGLTKAEREMIVVATSGANDCLYCVVAHGAILRVRTKQPELADQLAIDYRKADLEPRQRAMLDYAVKLALQPAEVDESDLERLYDAGFDDEEIWDIGAITALYALSNRLAHLLSLRPNHEFYLMGRVPKDVYADLRSGASSRPQHQPAAGD